MDEFAEKVYAGLMLLAGSIAQWDETTLTRLDDLESQLNVFGDAISCERELIEAALEDAGGADARGSKNNATKV